MFRRLLTLRGRLVAAGNGAALPLSFAPFGHWWLAPLVMALLFLLMEGESGRERALRGFWFGTGMFSTGTIEGEPQKSQRWAVRLGSKTLMAKQLSHLTDFFSS